MSLLTPLAGYFAQKNEKAPEYAGDIDVRKTQSEAVNANLVNQPYIEALMRQGNRFNQQQNLSLLEQAIPGYGRWAEQMSANAQSMGEGKLSEEQAANLNKLAGERGISTGIRGRANQYSLLRDFGIAQQEQQRASAGIIQTLAGLSKVNPMSPLSQYVTAQDALGVAQFNKSQYQAWLNAEQAAKNIRKNAFWSGLAAGDQTFEAAMGMGGGGGGGGGMGGFGKMFGGGKGGGLKDRNDPYSGDTLGNYGDTMDFSGGGAGFTESFGGGMTDMAGAAGNAGGMA